MNLIIDVGNTKTKLAVFDEDKLVETFKIDRQELIHRSREIKYKYSIKKGILSTVVELDTELIVSLKKEFSLLMLSHHTKVPFKNQYQSPTTLGLDRIALVTAAQKEYPNKNCLIIDAGTCITYDFLTQENIYFGGSISPGLFMRFKSLPYFTNKLPNLAPREIHGLIGENTETSIQTGIIHGVIAEVDDKIYRYKSEFGDLTVVLTGGDMNFLSKQLKNTIFATQNFLHLGLNAILNYNKF